MSVAPSDLAMHAEIDRFWQSVDQRTDNPPGVDEAHTDTPLFVWGILGTALALPQPHYRIFVPSPYYVVGWGLVANAAGNAVVKVEHAPRDAGGAVTFTSVTGGADPTLAGQQVVVTLRPTTWNPRTWGIYDLIHVYLSSTSGLEELAFQLFCRRMRRAGLQNTIVTSSGALVTTSSGVPLRP